MTNGGRHETAATGEGRPGGLDSIVRDLRKCGFIHEDIAYATGSRLRTVARWADGGTARRNHEDRLMELYRLSGLIAESVVADKVGLWFRTPNRFLDWRRPFDLLHRGGQGPRIEGVIEGSNAGYAT
jgi:hypothetical protein